MPWSNAVINDYKNHRKIRIPFIKNQSLFEWFLPIAIGKNLIDKYFGICFWKVLDTLLLQSSTRTDIGWKYTLKKRFLTLFTKEIRKDKWFLFQLIFRFLNYDQFHKLKTPCPCKSGGHRYFANDSEWRFILESAFEEFSIHCFCKAALEWTLGENPLFNRA